MSLFSWFSRKKADRAPASTPPSTDLNRLEANRHHAATHHHHHHGRAAAAPQPGSRKHERMARRELLYTVVRECMVNAGVLSSSYKFKVLSLDPRGLQYLVMVDLLQGAGRETARLAEIEEHIAQAARTRFDIQVTAVYWRSSDLAAVPEAKPAAHGHPARAAGIDVRPPQPPEPAAPLGSSPMPLLDVSQPAELMEEPFLARAGSGGRYDPLHPDEVAAFKQALANGLSAREAVAANAPRRTRAHHDKPHHHGPQNYTLLTGFEDTELVDSDATPGNALSATQYGDLR